MKRKMFLLTVLLVFCVMFMIGCKSDKKPNNTPETTGNDTTSSVQSPEQTTGAPETASPAVTTAKPAVTTAKPAETTAPVVEKLPHGEKVISIHDLDKLNTSKRNIDIVKAFLTGDRKKLDEMYSRREEVFAVIPSFELRSFEVWSEGKEGVEADTVYLKIDVSVSTLDTLPIGVHTLKIPGYMSLFEKVGRVEGTKTEPKTETEIFIKSWFKTNGYRFSYEYDSGDQHRYLDFIHTFYLNLRGEGGTRDEYIKYYKLLMGNEPGDLLDYYYSFEKDGKADYAPGHGHGGNGVWFDFVESGDDYVTVQFYIDHGYLIKGPVIRYNFIRVDGMLVPKTYQYISTRFEDIGPASYAA